MVDLNNGEFLYNTDGEQFLVKADEDENSYLFAVHGWQRIDKDRIDEYVNSDNISLYEEDIVTEAISQEGSEKQRRAIQMLQARFFELYGDGEMPDEGPHKEFVADDSNS